MKGATESAKRYKSLIKSLRNRLGKLTPPPVGDPIEQLFLGIFTRDVPEARAREAYDKLRSMVVDFNELRVIPSLELTEELGDYPDARLKCEDLSRALNRIFWVEHGVSLERLRKANRKDSLAYLDRIDGLEPYTRARIRLLGLGHHAMPVDEAMLAVLRRDRIVDLKAAHAEAQAFLERQTPEEEALETFTLLRKYAWTEMEKSVRRGEVEKIRSVPPDRTTRNMLRAVAEASDQGDLSDGLDEVPDVPDMDFGTIEGDPSGVDMYSETSTEPAEEGDEKSRPAAGKSGGKKKAARPAKTEEAGKGKPRAKTESRARPKAAKSK